MPKKKTRADGLVEIKRKVDGKVRHFYGRTKREAESKYCEALVDAARQKETSSLFEEVAEEWWGDYQKKIKPGTVRAYKGGYEAAVNEFSGLHMKEITPGLVNTWGLRFQARGKAGGTARNARSVLSLIFKYWCVRDGEAYNPVPMVDLPRRMKKSERQPPTPEQLATVKAHPEGFGLCAWLFMYTGCRLGEIIALQWKDVDLDTGFIHITKSTAWIHNQPVIGSTKTEYEAGVGELEAQRLLGHADISTTRKIYTHLRESQMQEATSKLELYFEEKS